MMMSPYTGNVRDFFKKMMPASIINVTNNNSTTTNNVQNTTEKKGPAARTGPVLDNVAKRALLNEMKNEVRPLINQLCETMILKNTKMIRTDIKETSSGLEKKIKDVIRKIDKDVACVTLTCAEDIKTQEKYLDDECKIMARKLARDRSDYDRKLAV